MGIEIRHYQETDLHRLFAYWQQVGADIPYFFPVSAQRWQVCLLEDEFDGEPLFKSLKTWLATESGQVLGFVQYGQPNYAWDESGEKHPDPPIGVIRQLFFRAGRDDAGRALLEQVGDHAAGSDRLYAFYHILGMSCNAHHGKLHHSQSHVGRLLRAYGFQVEHENVYYVLDGQVVDRVENTQLRLCSTCGLTGERFEASLGGEVVGTAHVRYCDALTGGRTRDTAYLTWIGVGEPHQGQGIGTEFLRLLVCLLTRRQVRYLHTDTARRNIGAQRFYESLGFQSAGCTRSYVQG